MSAPAGGQRDRLADEAARLSPRTVNRMLSAVVRFYEFHGRDGNDLAQRLVVDTRSGYGGFKPFCTGSRARGRAVRGAAAGARDAAADVARRGSGIVRLASAA